MLKERDLVRIAKRENNNKRAYLVVNPCQGKHVPVMPHTAMEMFWELGKKVEAAYSGERLLLIGFAETATAIGAAIACQIHSSYMQTTREPVPGADYLFFSEEHSHATEQKIVREDFEQIIGSIQRIVFVEDEITTGNTIMNIITLLKKTYGERVLFSTASLLNGMDRAHEQIYRDKGIEMLCLLRTSHEDYETAAEQAEGDGRYVNPAASKVQTLPGTFREIHCCGYVNARRLVPKDEYGPACAHLWQQVQEQTEFESCERILVLGTEEFMYPALYVAYKIEELGKQVRFHATTRSPIVVSMEPEYPLHTRYSLSSLYDSGRTTYLYDLQQYDKALVITDAVHGGRKGMEQIADGLIQNGTTDITYITWKDEGTK